MAKAPKKSFYLSPKHGFASTISLIYSWLGKLDTGKKWHITIEEGMPKRSSAQNNYLWGVVYPAIREFYFETKGELYEISSIHEYCLDMLPQKTVFVVDKRIDYKKSSATLTTKEFHDFLEYKIIPFFAENGCVIPEPDWDWRKYRKASVAAGIDDALESAA